VRKTKVTITRTQIEEKDKRTKATTSSIQGEEKKRRTMGIIA
jgi:hypothetical protein